MKLLNRSLFGFLIYAVAVLLIVTPVLYVVINNMIIHQVDETLQVHKREITSRLEKLPSEQAITQWEDLDGEVFVEPIDRPFPNDSIYTLDMEKQRKHERGGNKGKKRIGKSGHSHDPEKELYRVLRSSVIIKGKPYKLQAQVSLVESEALIRTLAVTQFFVLLLLLSGMLVINWWQARTVWSPFYSTLDKLKSFRLERNPAFQPGNSKIKEFNDLNNALIELTQRDHAAYTEQREFTENAAHEMQTPLAIFQSKVELMLQTQPSEEQAVLIESLLDATSRLNKLNKSLLLLAKIDNRQFPETEHVDLKAMTDKLLSAYENDIKTKALRITVDSRQQSSIHFNPALLDILLSNLISNAIRHSGAGAEVNIVIAEGSWSVKNSGEPLSIPSEKIFERFQKGTANQASLGLGLAIAKKICDVNNSVLTYSYHQGNHIFSVSFDKSKLSPKSEA